MYQPPVSVSKVLEGIHNSQYVLPAIQREFIWDTDQICKLFDSLMLGYPIGAFLFWKVEAKEAGQFAYYDFITDYHEKDSPYAPPRKIPAGQGATAILDGQQRLTALNIGLYGSHAERQPRKRWNNPDAFPKKRLYLNLLKRPEVDDQGMAYDFKFLTADSAKSKEGESDGWFPVKDVLSLANAGPAIMAELKRRSLTDTEPFEILYQLYNAVRETPSINAYLEESQDPNKVLDIFVRVNSGGTPLHFAASSGSCKVLRLLLKHGANVHARENDGKTPLEVATVETANVLRRHLARRGKGRKTSPPDSSRWEGLGPLNN